MEKKNKFGRGCKPGEEGMSERFFTARPLLLDVRDNNNGDRTTEAGAASPTAHQRTIAPTKR